MAVSISPVFNPYTLPTVSRPGHGKEHQGDHEREPRREAEHHEHAQAPAPAPAPEETSAPATGASRPRVGILINVRV